MKRLLPVLLLISSTSIFAKEKKGLMVTSISHQTDSQSYTYTIPGSPGQQNTSCTGNTTTYGSNTTGNVNCTTTTTGACGFLLKPISIPG
jgi:hypothetical protein